MTIVADDSDREYRFLSRSDGSNILTEGTRLLSFVVVAVFEEEVRQPER